MVSRDTDGMEGGPVEAGRSGRQWILVWCAALLFLAGSLLPAAVVRAATPDPSAQLRPFIDKVTRIISDARDRQDPNCNLCQRIIDVARERFDFREISKRVLGRQWRKLSREQQDEFVQLFTTLLQYAYVGNIQEYSGQKIEFRKQRIKGRRAEVQTVLVDQEKTIPVSYIMILKGDQWLVYDVVVEGVSLVRNYMEQFRQILRKEKYDGLVQKLRDKIKTLEQQRREQFARKDSDG
ncbi:MlaC/ttg2D family ABC transporter substrate-binding protein [Desulfolithobacter dissulfuricans]|uniref:MlaC/ttg2D family ABC transporter substrate-binding protein n=1 Tax=Desulfolithobacter dissulfuricans TaxID=2795293 RepID=UPI00227930C6|nr:ABC transporter substrate-binding protein [Desulfolithobacter dissulfuricans]